MPGALFSASISGRWYRLNVDVVVGGQVVESRSMSMSMWLEVPYFEVEVSGGHLLRLRTCTCL